MTHSPLIDICRERPPDEAARADEEPAARSPFHRPMEAVISAAGPIGRASTPARIYAALLRSIARLPHGGRCAVLEEFPNGTLACTRSHGLTAAEELALAAACRGVGPRSLLNAGHLLISRVGAPGSPDGQTLAVLRIGDVSPASFLAVVCPASCPLSGEDQDILRVLAGLAAAALQTEALRAESARLADRLRALHEIGVAVSRELDLNSLYEVVHRETARVLKVDAFYIALWDAEREVIHYPYSRDRGKCEIPEDSGLTDGPCSWVIRNRRPFVATEADRGVQDAGHTFGSGEASRSALHVPMLLGDRVVGVMSTQSYDTDAYGDEDLHLFQMVAGQTAVAVENARLYQAVQDLSFTDDLTGLPNRRAMVRRLEEELARAAQGDRLSILMLDLDHFKRVNDTHGHPVGDRVLCEAGALLRRSVRPCDAVGRWGGEEFVILLPNTDLRGAAVVAEDLRAAMAGHQFLDGRVPLPQTITIGGLSLRGPTRIPLHRLLESVDACLYRAKSAGRNRAILEDWTPDKGL